VDTKHSVSKGELAAASLNAYLIRLRLMPVLTPAIKSEARERIDNLNKRIMGHLRSDSPDIPWVNYPVARDYFTQN